MAMNNSLDEVKSSALKELANIGISHVATAMSEFVGEVIDISLPELASFSKKQLLETEVKNGEYLGAYVRAEGISKLTETLIFMPNKGIMGLMDRFINVNQTDKLDITKLSSEEQKSVFREIITVITATYFSAVDSMFNMKTEYDVPQISFLNEHLSEFLNKTLNHNESIYVSASFVSEKSKFAGKVMIIPHFESLGAFFRNIGIG